MIIKNVLDFEGLSYFTEKMKSFVTTITSKLETDVDVLVSRMDSFTKLEEGSTTGDAELVDARIDYKGTTYENVGAHIREATSKLSGDLDEVNELIISEKYLFTDDNISIGYGYNTFWSGDIFGVTANDMLCLLTKYIKLKRGVTYYYRNLYVSNCMIKYDSQSEVARISTSNYDLEVSGEFTAEDDGLLGITFYRFASKPLFTDKKTVYDKWIAKDVAFYEKMYFDNSLKSPDYGASAEKIGQIYDELRLKNKMDGVNLNDGYFWNYNNGSLALWGSEYSCSSNKPVALEKGKTYKYTNINADYCWIKNTETGAVKRVTECVDKSNGLIRAFENSELYITVEISKKSEALIVETQNTQNDIETIIVDKNGNGDFVNLVDGIKYAFNTGDVKIIVKNGIYDIIEEYGGEEEMLSTGDGANLGMRIGHNTSIIFENGAKVLCHYNGTNSDIKEKFSAFNAWTDDVLIENLNIECSNIRYAIHDEMSANYEYYHHKYVNCNMKINVDDDNVISAGNAIGGGLGHNGYIEITGGIYSSPKVNTIFYHNHATVDDLTAKSKIVVKDVYCEKGTILMYHCGKSTELTDCIVSGCSTIGSISTDYVSGHSTENMKLIAWNNEIRSE